MKMVVGEDEKERNKQDRVFDHGDNKITCYLQLKSTEYFLAEQPSGGGFLVRRERERSVVFVTL